MNFKNLFSLVFASFITLASYSQTNITVLLQPGPAEGQDATVSSLYPNDNFGNQPNINPYVGVENTNTNITRVYINFDFSYVNDTFIIDTAIISLFYDTTFMNGTPHSGSTKMKITRLLEKWDEDTITWNSQPNSDTTWFDIPAHTSPNEDYIKIDVTDLTQDMIDHSGNLGSPGFVIQFEDETPDKRIVWASSDNLKPNIRPALNIAFRGITTSLEDPRLNRARMVVYPQPMADHSTIKLLNSRGKEHSITIFNYSGQLVKQIDNITTDHVKINREGLSSGLYILQLKDANGIVQVKKLLVQ